MPFRAYRSNGRIADRDVLQVLATNQRRGAEVFATDLAGELASLGRRVRTVALEDTAPDTEGVPAEPLGRQRLGPSTLRALRAEAKGAGVVVGHGSTTLPAGSIASFLTRQPFIYRSIGDPAYWSASGLRRLRVGRLLQRATAVVVLWPGAADTLMTNQGVPASQIHVIPNGVPPERFPPVTPERRAEARRALGYGDDVRLAVYLGSLTPEKRVDGAITAIAALDDFELLVAGDGPERAKLEALAVVAAPGQVRFIGVVDRPADVLAAADVLVLPSRTEGIPAALIEAGLTGIPAVASDVGGVREVVEDGVTGYVVPPGDDGAIAHGIARAGAADGELGVAARERCLERFPIDSVAASWDAVLSEVGAGANGRAG